MKFILLLYIFIILFSLSSPKDKIRLLTESNYKPGKKIPGSTHMKNKNVLDMVPLNDNHFVTSGVIPHWETVCK